MHSIIGSLRSFIVFLSIFLLLIAFISPSVILVIAFFKKAAFKGESAIMHYLFMCEPKEYTLLNRAVLL